MQLFQKTNLAAVWSAIAAANCYAFPKWWAVADDIWSDDKAGASLDTPFTFPRDEKDRPLQLQTAQCLSSLLQAEEHDPNANSGHKGVSLYKSSGPPNNRDGQSVDLVGVVMCENQ